VVVRRVGSAVTERDLVQHCRQQLAGYKVPRSVDFVDELPRNPSGKVLKRILREPYWPHAPDFLDAPALQRDSDRLHVEVLE
jgi:acyl-CoA synthetase (AMP-forming)/AMP-acid ligase II